MSKTQKNLMEAFAGESQANRRYLAFADAADKEGYAQVATLFRAVAAAETVHAHAHLKVAGGIKDTAANLKEAIEGEAHEFKSMYPAMIKDAEAEGNKDAEKSFQYANAVEEVHFHLYTETLENLGKSTETFPYYVCKVCGYTVGHAAPDVCPVCKSSSKAFFAVN